MQSSRLPRIAFFAAAAAFLAAAGRAELGGFLPSVAADGAKMSARVTSVPEGSYTRHELTRPNGGVVHELTDARGRVFAVTWSGPGKPDLRVLLGDHFATFQASGSAIGRTKHALRRPPRVNEPDLQIQSEGHMGWFHGAALIPSLAPAGFSASDLRQER